MDWLGPFPPAPWLKTEDPERYAREQAAFVAWLEEQREERQDLLLGRTMALLLVGFAGLIAYLCWTA
jgi:hypothetical protein